MTRGDGSKTILLVEDNPDDVERTLRAFEQANIANGYVRKPVDFAEFVEATRQLGLYRLVLDVGAPER